jgi:hypothetical protein
MLSFIKNILFNFIKIRIVSPFGNQNIYFKINF